MMRYIVIFFLITWITFGQGEIKKRTFSFKGGIVNAIG